jgi:hypothetical protein
MRLRRFLTTEPNLHPPFFFIISDSENMHYLPYVDKEKCRLMLSFKKLSQLDLESIRTTFMDLVQINLYLKMRFRDFALTN